MARPSDFAIYFLCPDHDVPVGGIKVIYNQVDMLVAEGVQAFVLHNKPGFRCSWFQNETPIRYTNEKFTEKQSDIFVLPEVTDPDIFRVLQGHYKVIFNQNCYYTFEHLSPESPAGPSPYTDPSILGCMVVSSDSYNYLSYAFPELNLHRVRNQIDPVRFAYRADKKDQIAYMPRKNLSDATQVFQLLKCRGALDGLDIVPIKGMSAEKAAEVIAESRFFFSFGSPEGFSLPPAEAMATGSIVIGYHGWGGAEFLVDGLAYPIDTSDVLTFSQRAEKVLTHYRKEPSFFDTMGRKASRFIHSHYNPALHEDDLHTAWNNLLSTYYQKRSRSEFTVPANLLEAGRNSPAASTWA